MKLINLTDTHGRIHYININFIVDIYTREGFCNVITTNSEIHAKEDAAVILRKIIEAESNS